MGQTKAQGKLLSFEDFEVTLGDELRGERATLGKSLLDVQRDLKIKAAYVAAIENCDPTVFPNRGFVAGYVRSYARYLGLEPELIFERFCFESGFTSLNNELTGGHARSKTEAAALSLQESLRDVDPIVNPRVPNIPPNRGFLVGAFDNLSFSALGSIIVMLALIFGISYAGWKVLQDVQRVTFAPVDQTPVALDNSPAMERSALDGPTTGDVANIYEPANQDGIGTALDTLYRPQQYDVPVVTPRDGPIAQIDPNKTGVLAPQLVPAEKLNDPVLRLTGDPQIAASDPVVQGSIYPPKVMVYARKLPAWIRVYQKDGTRLFEKTLDGGEHYALPEDVVDPLLRAGMSGSVFLLIDGVSYGPIGTKTEVVKDVSLKIEDIEANFPRADVLLSEINLSPEEAGQSQSAEVRVDQ